MVPFYLNQKEETLFTETGAPMLAESGSGSAVYEQRDFTAIMFYIVFAILIPNGGMPFYAHRSALADHAYFLFGLSDWLITLFLTFIVFDATSSCLLFVKKLSRDKKSRSWPFTTMAVYDQRLQLPRTNDLINEWIGLDFVAKRSHCIGNLIYYPFVLLAIMILSRSTVFANFAPSAVIILTHGISLFIIFACALMVWLAAKSARDIAKERLTDGVISAKRSADAHFAKQLQILLNRVDQLKDGAFSPISQQPLFRALLFPPAVRDGLPLSRTGCSLVYRRRTYDVSELSYASHTAGRMSPCKVFRSNRTKMFT